jgi:hypothetical protein
MTRPQTTEAADYYFRYIDLVTSDDIVPAMEKQMGEVLQLLSGISEEQSLHARKVDDPRGVEPRERR